MIRGIRALIVAAVLLLTLPDLTLAKTASPARHPARSSHRVAKSKAPKLNKKNAYKVKPYRKFKMPKR